MRSLSLKVLGVGTVLGLASLTCALPAGASQEMSFTLSWQAPADCPAPGDVRAEVARLLGGQIRLPAGRDFKAGALVTHGQTWAVAIETELAGRAGRRFIEAASCKDLADATALILALMIDPDVVPTPHVFQPQPPQPPPPPVPVQPQPTPQKRPSPVDFLLGLHAQGSRGTLPSVDVGVGGGVGVVGRRFRVELRANYGLRRDQTASVTTLPGAYGQFNLWAAELSGCFNLGQEVWAFGPCADAEGGVVSARGVKVDQSLPAHRPWLAIGAGGYAAVSLSHRWSIPVHLAVLVPLVRPEYVFKDVPDPVFQAAPVGVRISSGIELRF